METIKNVANSASNAIFGKSIEESGNEPVSGKTGAGTVDEPYDQGNTDEGDGSAPQDKTSSASNPTSINPINSTSNTMSSQSNTGDPSSGQQPVQKQEGADRPTEAPTNLAENQAVKETKQEAETVQNASSDQQQQDSSDQQQQDSSDQQRQDSSDQQQQDSSDQQQKDPSNQQEQDPSTQQQQNSSNQQQDSSTSDKNVTRPMTDEEKHPLNEEERQEMAMKGQLPKIPGDRSGEPLHMHNGDEDADPGSRPECEENKPDRTASVGQEGGGAHGKEYGTGMKYVKSTGMAAEGGDFDATRPGAGREATRLMEEKGLHKSKAGGSDDSGKGKQPPSEPSKVEKLKEKLHIGTGKHGNEQSV